MTTDISGNGSNSLETSYNNMRTKFDSAVVEYDTI